MRDTLNFYVESVHGATLRVITDENGNEMGYQQKDISLAALLRSKGVTVSLNSEVVSVLRNPIDDSLDLHFAEQGGALLTRPR